MKKKLLLIFLSTTTLLSAQSPWSPWQETTCYKGIDFRTKRNGYNEYAKKFNWTVQFRNRYQKNLHLNCKLFVSQGRAAGKKATDRLMNIKPGETRGTWFLVASGDQVYVLIQNVRVGNQDDWGGPYYPSDKGCPTASKNNTASNRNSNRSANTGGYQRTPSGSYIVNTGKISVGNDNGAGKVVSVNDGTPSSDNRKYTSSNTNSGRNYNTGNSYGIHSSKDQNADELIKKGTIASINGNHQEAIGFYRQAKILRPNDQNIDNLITLQENQIKFKNNSSFYNTNNQYQYNSSSLSNDYSLEAEAAGMLVQGIVSLFSGNNNNVSPRITEADRNKWREELRTNLSDWYMHKDVEALEKALFTGVANYTYSDEKYLPNKKYDANIREDLLVSYLTHSSNGQPSRYTVRTLYEMGNFYRNDRKSKSIMFYKLAYRQGLCLGKKVAPKWIMKYSKENIERDLGKKEAKTWLKYTTKTNDCARVQSDYGKLRKDYGKRGTTQYNWKSNEKTKTTATASTTKLKVSLDDVRFNKIDKSPADIASYPKSYRISNKKVRILYSRPQLKGRDIKDLIPLGKVWRTGANESTEITFYQDVIFGGANIKAGTYSLFTIPGEIEWKIILNNKLNQWGAYSHDQSADMARVTGVVSKEEEYLEAFSITFHEESHIVNLIIGWGNMRIRVPLVL